jgi:hypothetical protein
MIRGAFARQVLDLQELFLWRRSPWGCTPKGVAPVDLKLTGPALKKPALSMYLDLIIIPDTTMFLQRF